MDRLAVILFLSIFSGLAAAQTGMSTSSVASINNLKNAAYCADTSVSANTITCSTAVGFTGYAAGQAVDVLLANSVTGATTINVNTLGAKAVTYNGTNALTSTTGLVGGGTYRVEYDGTRFVLQGVITTGSACPAGAANQIQFYVSPGVCGGSANLTWLPLDSDGETLRVASSTDTAVITLSGISDGYASGEYQIQWQDSMGNDNGLATMNAEINDDTDPLSSDFYISGPGALHPTSLGQFALNTNGDVAIGRASGNFGVSPIALSGDLFIDGNTGAVTLSSTIQAVGYKTTTNCADSAGAAACGSAAAGAFVIDAAATSTVVSTTAVTANSEILVMFDAGLGTRLGITCNAAVPTVYGVTARTAGTSFTLSATAPAVNPACFNYWIIN